MDNTEKARELINKHLYLHGGDGLGITDGDVYRAVLDAVSEALTIPIVSERFFSCDCKGEGLLLTKDEDDKSIYFALYGYGVGYNPKPSLIERIKYAWYHIKTGKKYADCIIMDYQKAKEVGNWLDSNAR